MPKILNVAGIFVLCLVCVRPARAQAPYWNATEQSAGTWYGSRATLYVTGPILRTGQWTYHRTVAYLTDPDPNCRKFAEIGWIRQYVAPAIVQTNGLISWKNGCGGVPQLLAFSMSYATHVYQSQWSESSGAPYKYNFYIDAAFIAKLQTNFSATSTVICGGEVYAGVEAMGNTYCGGNYKMRRDGPNIYTAILWGGHTNWVDNAPYTNVNNPSDSNGFWSTGNEAPTPTITPVPFPTATPIP